MLECAKFCLNWPSGSTEEDKNVKKFTDDKQMIKKLMFQDLSARVSFKSNSCGEGDEMRCPFGYDKKYSTSVRVTTGIAL